MQAKHHICNIEDKYFAKKMHIKNYYVPRYLNYRRKVK